jgi:hypothetical protein
MNYKLNKKQIDYYNRLELKKELKQISLDYNISLNKVIELYNVHECIDEITFFLDEHLLDTI